jgi:hypothetical protein
MADIDNEKQAVPIAGGENMQQPLQEKREDSTIAPPPPAVENLVTRDGIRLHPQPTTDPLDPLNWSSFQKHSILAIVMFKYVHR